MYFQYQKSLLAVGFELMCISGMNGKNLPLPRLSLESPAVTPSSCMHLPILTSSADPASDFSLHLLFGWFNPFSTNNLTAALLST